MRAVGRGDSVGNADGGGLCCVYLFGQSWRVLYCYTGVQSCEPLRQRAGCYGRRGGYGTRMLRLEGAEVSVMVLPSSEMCFAGMSCACLHEYTRSNRQQCF